MGHNVISKLVRFPTPAASVCVSINAFVADLFVEMFVRIVNCVHGEIYFYRPQRSWGKVIFSEACVNNSVHGGACMVAPGGGHVWFYSRGVHGFIWGACMVLFRGGMCGFFSFFRYNEIRSMSGRYASYWNAFLLTEGFPFTQ